ncbi:hypothetical protein Bca4012_030482 [Brassica carinata]|uniref:(rape) hypothetical protein n=1 Tax=Brassica napus TaxID=3708 RepID=A0A816J9G5_BRANA|nr:unnamed protein product [Brassica napus]
MENNKEFTTDSCNTCNGIIKLQVEDTILKETDSTEAFPEKYSTNSSSEFGRQQRQITELCALCNVPLVHRTYIFLLFKGDPSEYVYMEVEFRRLSFLKQTIANDAETLRFLSSTPSHQVASNINHIPIIIMLTSSCGI